MVHELLWRITFRCNMRCSFCFNDVFQDKVDKTVIENYDWTRLDAFLRQYQIQKVYLSGGEPAVVDCLPDIIAKLATTVDVVIFSNGLFLNRYTPEQIALMPLKGINVSLNNAAIIKQSPALLRTLDVIRHIRLIGCHTKVNTQLMIDSHYFDLLASKGYDLTWNKFDRILWQPLVVPVDHPLYPITLQGMKPSQTEAILDHLEQESKDEMVQHVRYIRKVYRGHGYTCAECLMGSVYLTMNPDMTINKCPHINQPGQPIDCYIPTTDPICCDRLSMRCVCLYSHLCRRYGKNMILKETK